MRFILHNMSTGGRDQENGKTWKQAGLLITVGNIHILGIRLKLACC